MDTQPKSFRLVDEEECPPVFRKLETLAPSRHSPLRTGGLHIAIQGDNFFRDVKYTLTVSLLDPSFKDQVLEAEESLASKRDEVSMRHSRFVPTVALLYGLDSHWGGLHFLVTLFPGCVLPCLSGKASSRRVGCSRLRVWNRGCLKGRLRHGAWAGRDWGFGIGVV